MLFLDKKYISIISSKLERFSWKRGNLAVCRCPKCGDSSKNKSKTRFYFFPNGSVYFVKCHNCGFTNSFRRFLKDFDSNRFKEYQFELFQETSSGQIKREVHEEEKVENDYKLPRAMCLTDLPDNHPAKVYITSRKIPEFKLSRLFYTDNFNLFAQGLVNEVSKLPEDPRIILPFYDRKNRLTYVQGRSLEPNAKIRYASISLSSNDRVYGLADADITKPVIIVEGPLDSLFLSNGLAIGGSSNHCIKDLPWGKDTMTIVYDNEPRGKEICKLLRAAILNGYKVCIWPKSIVEKDINDMVLAGIDVESVINQNTFQGIEAKLRFDDWQKVNV